MRLHLKRNSIVNIAMQPWRHAKLSANKFGGHWREYLAIHEFIDSAKAACPDLRHRIVLHNSDLGVALAKLKFPNISNVEDIVAAHIFQDLTQMPKLSDWLETAKGHSRLRERSVNREALAKKANDKIGLTNSDPFNQVYDLLILGEDLCGSHGIFGKQILMNSFGPHLVRNIIGPAYEIENKVFDPSWVAEGIIVAHFGYIPALQEVLQPFDGRL